MKQEVFNTFGRNIELEKAVSVSAKDFSELFSDAEELSYDELTRVEEENDYGYKKYIEEWKKEGLID